MSYSVTMSVLTIQIGTVLHRQTSPRLSWYQSQQGLPHTLEGQSLRHLSSIHHVANFGQDTLAMLTRKLWMVERTALILTSKISDKGFLNHGDKEPTVLLQALWVDKKPQGRRHLQLQWGQVGLGRPWQLLLSHSWNWACHQGGHR